MNTDYFAYYYARSYRRVLTAACVGLTIVGVGSAVGSHVGSSSFDTVVLPAPTTPQVTVAPKPIVTTASLKQLPGRDGTGSLAGAPKSVVVPAPIASQIVAGGDMRAVGRAMNALRFGDNHWGALNALWTRESGWNPNARNRSSGACGIPQALPCSKIPDMSPEGQIAWGLSYIQARYGNPTNAWHHSQRFGWY